MEPAPKSPMKMLNPEHIVNLRHYMEQVRLTDTLPPGNAHPVLMGLFGEVGSILVAGKKLQREKKAYPGYQQAIEEEFGDTLWYFNALCRRLGIGVDDVMSEAANRNQYGKSPVASGLTNGSVTRLSSVEVLPSADEALVNLAKAATALFGIDKQGGRQMRHLLCTFAECFLLALDATGVNLSGVMHRNIGKTKGRFLEYDRSSLPRFDSSFPEEEQIPQHFEIKITQRSGQRSYLQWNKVFIGEPLTDNISDPDGYRFHDVFHLSHAAILHWSPTFRRLIKQKRKSDPKVDEAEDGGRAIVVEEGLTAWIFSRAKQLDFFEGQDSLSFDLLKTVQQFVQGYEVEECPLKLWEEAILEGYKVFRQVRKANGGIVVGDRENRTIKYKPVAEG